MDLTSMPLAILFGYTVGKNDLIFVAKDGDIKLTMKKHRATLIGILALCNGQRTLSQIREKVTVIKSADFDSLIAIAEEFKLICDSRDLYLDFHVSSSNPLKFNRTISPTDALSLIDKRVHLAESPLRIKLPILNSEVGASFRSLIESRKSTRSFTGEALSAKEMSELLRSMYTLGQKRSIPSAGQLYPLEIYVAVLVDNNEGIPRGVYHYDALNVSLNPLDNVIISNDQIGWILNSYQAEKAAIVVFISANLKRHAEKYANRGYRFTMMEVGHAAQNAHLYCAEAKLGMVEYGGFQDKLATEYLRLKFPENAVVHALIFGREDMLGQAVQSFNEVAYNLSQQLIGKGKPIEYVSIGQPVDGSYKLPRVEVGAKYRQPPFGSKSSIPSEERFGSGLAVTSDEAVVKALAEAYERYVSGKLRIDSVSAAVDLKMQWLDPHVVIPLKPLALERYGWIDFSEKKEWQWVEGIRYFSNGLVMVPVDIVFYPLSQNQLGREVCYSANSSGVAAHTDNKTASVKALLELVERDAIAVTWYAKRKVRSVPIAYIPEDIRLRMDHWKEKGWNVKVLDLTLDSVPVMLVMIYSDVKYPSFVAGASASMNWSSAIEKAWDEAEIFLLNWKNQRKVKATTSEQLLYSPLDHGKLYFRGENLNQVNWLIESEESQPRFQRTWSGSDLLQFYDPVLVDLNPGESGCDLRVVRAISEKLLPLNFGFGNEHFGHRRLRDLGLVWERNFPAFPHFFA